MLNLHLYMSFCVFAVILAFTPGPNVLLMVKYGLEYKLKEAFFSIPGIALALLTYAIIVSIGLSRVLTKYPASYDFIRIAGACYLIYMGISGFYKQYKSILSPTCREKSVEDRRCRLKLFSSGYFCALTNPKILVMYLAFFPQFIDHSRKPFPQFCFLGITHVIIVMLSMTTYCTLAHKSRKYINKYAKIQYVFTNSILLILGLFLLFVEHKVFKG